MANKAYHIAIVGNRDAILPFMMIGFQTFSVTSPQEAVNQLRDLARKDFGIIYLTEDIAAQIPETIAYYDSQLTPAVILLPTHKGSLGLGLKRIEANVEKAVGQNIL